LFYFKNSGKIDINNLNRRLENVTGDQYAKMCSCNLVDGDRKNKIDKIKILTIFFDMQYII